MSGLAMSVETDEMVLMHVALRRELSHAPVLVRAAQQRGGRAVRRTARHVAWLLEVLHAHHDVEDRHLWPLLLQRCPDEVAPVVHLAEAQHEGIAALVTAASERLTTWRSGPDDATAEALAQVLEQLVAALVEHLSTEEQHVLPLAETHLAVDEWERMGAEGMAAEAKHRLLRLLGMFALEGDPRVLDGMLAAAPRPVRWGAPRLGLLVYRGYARRLPQPATG